MVQLLETPTTLEAVNAELAAIEICLQRHRWAADPDLWASEKLGDTLWSGQRTILNAVRDYRKTAVPTCHEIGKSYDAGILAAWWIDTHKSGEAFVVTTAPTNLQVKVILWKEIGRAHSRGKLAGRINTTGCEWKMRVVDPRSGIAKEEVVAMGRKPNDYTPDAFQGVHAPFVLIIVDEGNGVRGPLWNALDSLMANDGSKLVIIGNPDDPEGEFYEASKPGSGFKVVHISAFDSPNFTGEELSSDILRQLIGPRYVEERRAKWAPTWHWVDAAGARVEPLVRGQLPPPAGVKVVAPVDGKMEDTHPFWQSKVLGQFPVQTAAGSLIPLSWIRAAQERTLRPIGLHELGMDVGASDDGDSSCCGERKGPVFRVLWEQREPDTMKTTGRLLKTLRETQATRAKVDYIGVGRGVVDRCREQKEPVHPIQVGESGTRHSCKVCHHEWDEYDAEKCLKCGSENIMKVFADLLSQLWWDVRGLFERGEIDLDEMDEDLAAELVTLRWEPNSKGQLKVFYGAGPSPNRADSLLMTFAPVIVAPAGSFKPTGIGVW